MIQYECMKRFAILFSLLMVMVPSFVWAEDATTSVTSTICSCYCKTSGGAMNVGVQNSTSDCKTACDSTSGYSLLGCYTDAQSASLPENSQLCWTEYECTTQVDSAQDGSSAGTEGLAYEWGGQSASCISGEGPCYKPVPPVTLGVAIADMTSATDLPSYLNAIYNWLIPAGALLAIIMIMLGGLQYALAHGDKGKITKATDRIKNALIGMILLMFTFAILNLIDPNLVTFNNLRVPQIRTVVYLDPASTCEVMASAGLTITSTTAETSCGNKGTVSSLNDIETSITVGTQCTYSTCPDGGIDTCMSVASAPDGFACVSCSDSYNDALIDYQPNPDAPAPSASTCSSLLYHDPFPDDANHYYCEYLDTSFTEVTQADSCVELVYPANDTSTNLDCVLLLADAYVGDSISCRMYDNVWAKLQGNSEWVFNNEVDDIQTGDTFPLLTTLCEADPCGLAPPGHSCKVFTASPEEAASFLTVEGYTSACESAISTAGAVGGLAACASGLAVLAGASIAAQTASEVVSIANCAPDDSTYGVYHCLDKYGSETDCNPTW